MADRVIAGAAPPADADKWTPGTVWMQLVERASDATGKTIGVNLWSSHNGGYVAVNFAGPGREQHGGPWLYEQKLSAWETPPAGDNKVGKIAVSDIALGVEQFYRLEAQVSEVRTHLDFQAGRPNESQMGPDIDSEKVRDNTYAGRMKTELRNLRDMSKPTTILGSPRKGSRR